MERCSGGCGWLPGSLCMMGQAPARWERVQDIVECSTLQNRGILPSAPGVSVPMHRNCSMCCGAGDGCYAAPGPRWHGGHAWLSKTHCAPACPCLHVQGRRRSPASVCVLLGAKIMKLCGREAGSDSPIAPKYPFLWSNLLFPLLLALKRALKGLPPTPNLQHLAGGVTGGKNSHAPWCGRILW